MDELVQYDVVVKPGDEFRIRDPAQLAYFQQKTEEGDYDLSLLEIWWRDRYESLLRRGYQLRPRFRPDWKPSWLGTDYQPLSNEDGYRHLTMSVIDAKRLSDGKIVAIKQLPSGTDELRIATMLSSPERLQDPKNHCVPVYDHFHDELDAGIDFMVMPILRKFFDPPFCYVDEVVDFVRQTLEGLVYIHSQNVAHRDLSDGNIMLDGRPLYLPGGFHPSWQDRTAADITKDAVPRARSDVRLVRYYITDFGLSTLFEEAGTRRLVTGSRAQDKDVPELSNFRLYDPFLVDVFTLGMVYKRRFLDKYSNLAFLNPLVAKMTQKKPSNRPSATQALAQFESTLSGLTSRSLRWRLCTADEKGASRILRDVHCVLREIKYTTKSLARNIRPPIIMLLLLPVTATSIILYTAPQSILSHIRSLIRRR